MKWNSVRVRLALWITVVLAAALGGFGLILCFGFQHRMNAALDQDLAIQAHPFSSGKYPLTLLLRDINAFAPQPETVVPATEVLTRPLNNSTQILLIFKRPHRFEFANRFEAHDRDHDREEAKARREAKEKATDRARDRAKEEEEEAKQGEMSTLAPTTLPVGPWDAKAIPLALHGGESYSTRRVGEQRYRVLTIPLRQREHIVGSVEIARDLSDYDRQWSSQIQTLLALLPLSLLVAAGGGLFLTSRVLRPIREVTRAAAQIGDRDLTRRLAVTGDDEFAELAATFNGMIARLETAFQNREEAYNRLNAAYEQQQRFTADASHELRTPLSRIKVSTSMALAEEQTEEEYRTALGVADKAADAMNRLIQQLLLLASADAGQLAPVKQPLDVMQALRETIDLVPNPQHIPLCLTAPPDAASTWLQGDPDHLARIFTNLLENALRHTSPTGQVTISVQRSQGNLQPEMVIEITDTGEGIPPEHLPHILERFYRVDAARTRNRGGSGLGLPITQSLVQANGGSLSITSAVGQGTKVTVRLSCAE